MATGEDDAARGVAIALGEFVDGVPESLALGFDDRLGRRRRCPTGGILVGNVVHRRLSAELIGAGP
jgi:hypothetical protein